MGVIDKIDDGGRVIAGLLGYNPGPGLYSRMSRAVEQMPKVIRTQELPGLLRKYPEGVPGWEVKAVAPALEGVESIPRQDLLDLIQQHSPAYTHKEVVLGGKPQQVFQPEYYVGETPSLAGDLIADFQRRPSPLGAGVSHGVARYRDYGQGGDNYSEVLLLQPNALGEQFGSHWHGHSGAPGVRAAVAHARFDTHGDALRINELQSDLGIHNRRQREYADNNPQIMFGQRLNPAEAAGLPFPLEDAWADILIKRLALEAARKGHRAIEVASPRSIADKVGGNIDNYEHFYGKVVPGAIERLGRKMGGVVDVTPRPMDGAREIGERLMNENAAALRAMDEAIDDAGVPGDYGIGLPIVADIGRGLSARDDLPGYRLLQGTGAPGSRIRYLADLPANIDSLAGIVGPENMNAWMLRAGEAVAAQRRAEQATLSAMRIEDALRRPAPARRYIMSDEMRRRILQQGIGLGVLGPLLGEAGTNSEEN